MSPKPAAGEGAAGSGARAEAEPGAHAAAGSGAASPSGASLRERDARVIANIARLRFSPLALVGGRGCRLIEEGGRELLDLSASFGAASLGYSHPAIRDAVTAACGNMAGASLLSYPNENAPRRRLRRVWPSSTRL